ncbi:MAG: M20/M25/M40 family metallo-hydrolase [Ardenticatenaceae bacterium]|nr:M20/M25/M40 family metallo-hydrolase [Ardenticatenaceae bacterium]
MDTFKLLQTLTETPGPSGFEQPAAAIVQELWEPYVDSITTDRVGSVIAIKKGQGAEPRPRLLIAAHIDEIGLLVSKIEERFGSGFLRLTALGGIDIRHVHGQVVEVHGRRTLTGVLGGPPSFMQTAERQGKPYNYEDIVADVGLPYEELKELVSIGDYVTFRQPLRQLQNKRVTGKALDNRSSVAALTLCLEQLNGRSHTWDVLAIATSQEETRLLGAATTAHAYNPDAALAIDVTFAKAPGVSGDQLLELGEGPALDLGPNVHPGMLRALQDTAQAIEMKVHIETHNRGSGTDGMALQVARAGIPTGIIGLPLRNMHTVVEVVDMADVERCGRLMAEFVTRLDDQFLPNLVQGMMEK